MCIPNFRSLAQIFLKLWPIVKIQDGRRPPSWISWKLIQALFHDLSWLRKSHFKLNFTLIGSLVHKLRHFLYLPNVHGPYLAWDWKPEVDCRVIRLPVSILTSYSDFSGSYSYLKVSLKILSDDVLRTLVILPLERSLIRWKFLSPKWGVILRVLPQNGEWTLILVILTPKRHFLGPNDIFWGTPRKNPFTGLRWAVVEEPPPPKKKINK